MHASDPDKWESVARLLKADYISNAQVSARLGVTLRFVARVRKDLGIPSYSCERPWTQERFDAMTRQLRGGHLRWMGRHTDAGLPVATQTETAYRVGFRLHHGREPVGRVQGTCSRKRCVAGAHLQDRLMRQAAGEQTTGLTQDGMDLVAIRRALQGDPPYPPLKPKEKRYAFLQAHPDASLAELSERLGCSDRTISRWREKGVPS
ncbi:hypothetical protein ACFVHS_25100 [Streptomyces sp. NPDC057746]|uniref:hypothetical protein n=1 Tax=Streptomyces sp. NPDC057746 TaxID=3346237 RepID=UPI0036D06276